MKSIILILSLFSFTVLKAQCDLTTISDPASGVSLVQTNKQTIVNGVKDKTSIRFKYQEIDYMVNLDIKTFTDKEFKLSIKDSLIFFFEDGTQMVLFPMELYYVKYDKNRPTQLVQFTPDFYIAEEDVEILSTKKISRYKLNMTGKSFDFEVKSKYVKDVQKAAQCILDVE